MSESGAGVDGGAREPTRAEREARRDTFLGDAADYAAARPGYPDEVLEAAVALAGLAPGARVLELGCGTGFATSWLAERGFEVLAVDRSAEMAAYAREALAGHPTVEVRVGDFESLAPEGGRDAVVAATSYHWLDPVDRAARCAAHLRRAARSSCSGTRTLRRTTASSSGWRRSSAGTCRAGRSPRRRGCRGS